MDSRPALLLKNFRKDLVEAFPDIRDSLDEPVELSADPRVAAARQAYQSLVKKWEPKETSNAKLLSHRAIAGFLACNDLCSAWRPTEHPFYRTVLELVRTKCYEQFDGVGFCWSEIFSRSRMGPGASVSSRGLNSSFEKLYLNRMSTTSLTLYRAFVQSVRPFPLLLAAEKQRSKRYGSNAVRLVAGSTLSCVRKNFETDRTVCTEASLNMYAQLGLGEVFNDLLRQHYGYCPELQQQRNRELARRGSVGNNIATVDSTSASDLIALLMTKWTLHPLLSAAIDDCRSESVKVDKQYIELHMVSSMGNGFTFPLMTYLFCVIIESLCEVLDVPFCRFDVPGSPFGVFGDDICIPTRLYEPLCGFLKSVGFKPNMTKSFHEGPFRESCGGDFFKGANVRGVYIRKLDQNADFYSAINRLNVWSARHCIPLKRTIRFLLPKGWTRHAVPCYEDDSSGIMTTCFGDKPSYTCLKPKIASESVYLVLRSTKRRPKPLHVGLYRRFDNPMGALLSVINGSLRDGMISRRQRVVVYEEASRSSPNIWACEADFAHDVPLWNWEVLHAINLGFS